MRDSYYPGNQDLQLILLELGTQGITEISWVLLNARHTVDTHLNYSYTGNGRWSTAGRAEGSVEYTELLQTIIFRKGDETLGMFDVWNRSRYQELFDLLEDLDKSLSIQDEMSGPFSSIRYDLAKGTVHWIESVQPEISMNRSHFLHEYYSNQKKVGMQLQEPANNHVPNKYNLKDE